MRMSSLVSIGTAAKELGVHPATLRRWEEGKINPPERTTGGDRRYDLSKRLLYRRLGKAWGQFLLHAVADVVGEHPQKHMGQL